MENGQRTKILFVITKSVWGGAQRYVFDLATNLSKDEFEVAVALGPQEKGLWGMLGTKLENARIPVSLIQSFQKSINPIKDISAFFELLALYNHFKPDIIHVNSSKAGGIACAAAVWHQFITGKRTNRIFTVHGWAFLEDWRPHWQRALIRFASKLTACLCTRVIVISKRDYDSALSYNVAPSSKVTYIPNGIGTFSFREKNIAQKELLKKEHALVVGVIAEWTKNKGLTYVLEAMPVILKEFPETVLCLVGWGKEGEKLKMKSKKLQLDKNIFFVSKNEAATYLKAFDIFVLPSLKEGLPYTILEAGLARLPVVATRVGGIPDIIEHEKQGILIDPCSSEQLADKIIQLLRNSNAREQLGNALHERVVKNFSFGAMLEKTTHVYRL